MENRSVLYNVTLNGICPLLMHRDNISFTETVDEWRKNNKKISKAGDDRSPAWTWVGYCYTDTMYENLIIPSDNIMTLLREAGAKISTGKGKKTYKTVSQYGIVVPNLFFKFYVNGKEISKNWMNDLVGNNDFSEHVAKVREHGFELFLKRARVGTTGSKHVRVRPMFQNWQAFGQLQVIDEEETGIKEDVLRRILEVGGAQVGLCDWRPSSPASGYYGKFSVEIEKV